jgi:hypothetical protein
MGGRTARRLLRPAGLLPRQPPAPGDVAHFVAVAARYGYTLGTPEQNAAVGIDTPEFANGG